MKLPKGVLFDFDGVVVDSFETHFSAWKKAFSELFGFEINDFPENCEGKSPMLISKAFCEIANAPEKANVLYSKKEHNLNNSSVPPKLLPGVVEITSLLKKENIPYGIASNATKQFLLNSVQQLNLDFNTIFGFEDYEKPKPAPEAYITLAKALGFDKASLKDLWVFEDSIAGTTAAKLAGMQPMGILTHMSEKALIEAGSVKNFKDLAAAHEFIIELKN